MAGYGGVVLHQHGRVGRVWIFVRIGLRQPRHDTREAGGTEGGQQIKARLPAKPDEQIAADDRAQRRGQRHGRAHVGQHARGMCDAVHVTHHGTAQHGSAAAAQRLEEAGDDERFDGSRQRAGGGCREIDDEPGNQHGPPPEAVRQRAVNQLRQGKAQQEYGQGELHLRYIGVEHANQRRE